MTVLHEELRSNLQSPKARQRDSMLQCAAFDSSIFARELQRSSRVSLEAARLNERHAHVKAAAVRGEL
jgi:hypothetical protein